ncbi:MAG: putative membrane protein [Patescibacteria group bacterium]|jgi:uncharacterized membrane protein
MKKKGKISVAPNNRSLGEKAADIISKWAGSWAFILSFLGFLVLWMIANTYLLLTKQWDPYPFIFLNFILSCLAALQAPVILMSQSRQAQIDRQRFEYDYRVDRKAEREISEIQKNIELIRNSLIKKKRK